MFVLVLFHEDEWVTFSFYWSSLYVVRICGSEEDIVLFVKHRLMTAMQVWISAGEICFIRKQIRFF
jgi:hypothetical protein